MSKKGEKIHLKTLPPEGPPPAWRQRLQEWLRQAVIFVCISSGILVLYILLVDNFAMPYLVAVEQVRVPPLADMPVDQARQRLDRLGLRLTVSDSAHSEQFAAGRIVDQTPEPGRQVKENRRIAVIVSRGQRLYPAPSLRGVGLRDARLQLAAARLQLGRMLRRSSETLPEGAIINQRPPATTPLPPGGRVDIEISSGSPRLPKAVPDLAGLTVEAVEDTLDAYEMALGRISESLAEDLEAGIVLSQDPPPSARAQRLTPIDITVSVLPLPGAQTPPREGSR